MQESFSLINIAFHNEAAGNDSLKTPVKMHRFGNLMLKRKQGLAEWLSVMPYSNHTTNMESNPLRVSLL